MTQETFILVLFDSRGGLIEQLAQALAEGVRSVPGAVPVLRRVEGVQREEVLSCDGLVLGSPNWSGLTGKMKSCLDGLGDVWQERQLEGKPGAAFTAGASRSAGIEATLFQLIHWLLAGGMVIVGLPWTERMRSSGSYYGATASDKVQPQDLEQARSLGRRVAQFAAVLKAARDGPSVE